MAEKKKGARAGESEDLLRLDVQLCFAVYTASNLITRLYRPLLDPLGITYSQYLAMMALWEHSPRTVGELGEALGLDSGTLTPLLKRLEANGLVARKRAPEDERRVLVELTSAGQKLRARAASIPKELMCKLPIQFEEATELRDALRRLTRGLQSGPEGNEG
ncbi:MarR family winged helix-turn-helix transcriptional regulator [Archangium lansingense]|uniref:MarR family winged helix-turn-helix transcriptional regulator n=1 Tax=Archangium lansingense TaxID=2995310 RepID=UPI003B7E51B2